MGTEQRVLVERISHEGIAEGHTENYLQTTFAVQKAQHGTIVSVQLIDYLGDGVLSARELHGA